MSLLGIDTSTAASAACVLRDDGQRFEVEPAPAALGARPEHARELMPAIADAMERAGLELGDLEAIAVGVGPGAFTGLRIGITTARGLASASGLLLKPVSSLAALAAGMGEPGPGATAGDPAPAAERGAGTAARPAPAAERGADAEPPAGAPALLPLIDAKRGELFGALHGAGGEPLWAPFAATPERLVERVREAGLTVRAAGDGSLRFRWVLEAAGIGVDPDESRSHVVRALHVCRLATEVPGEPPETVLPDYLRAPDAKPR